MECGIEGAIGDEGLEVGEVCIKVLARRRGMMEDEHDDDEDVIVESGKQGRKANMKGCE